MSLAAESMGLGSSCLARQRSARQAEATPGRTSRPVVSARQDEKGVPWFWKILYIVNITGGYLQLPSKEHNVPLGTLASSLPTRPVLHHQTKDSLSTRTGSLPPNNHVPAVATSPLNIIPTAETSTKALSKVALSSRKGGGGGGNNRRK